jgi:shikimate dehydrogenase
MTDRYAVIGNPIRHSKSPGIHMAFAAATGQDMAYERLEAPADGFAVAVDAFRAAGGRGLNVTAPFKLDACAYATRLQDRARLAGAANAIAFDGAEAMADNFDGAGLVRDIVGNLGCALQGRRVLLLGAGGATRGALLPVLEQRPAEVVIANRTAAKAEALALGFASHGPVAATGYDGLTARRGFDAVINATSASLHGALPGITAAVFAPGCLAYDMAYGQGLTPFLRLAREAGAMRLADGTGMLVEQAAEAFAWWRGVRPATQTVIAEMAVPLD